VDDLTVKLDEFAGPLDLLLYLIRKEEVEVEALPVARVTEQYLAYLEKVPATDLDRAGEFLVYASTLLNLKARALLPKAEDPGAAGAGEPPTEQARLVRELLEYRDIREKSRRLEELGEVQAHRFGRISPRREGEPGDPLAEVDLWDLVTAFDRLAREVSLEERTHVVEDEVPLAVYVERLRARLAAARGGGGRGAGEGGGGGSGAGGGGGGGGRGVAFRALFDAAPTRAELVAIFLSLLELIRTGEARAVQAGPFGEIRIEAVATDEGGSSPSPGTT